MTEYHTGMNGSSNGHSGYSEIDPNGGMGTRGGLEESMTSLLSNESIILPNENKTARSLYRKCAKLFINKKFEESFKNCQQLADVSLSLVEQQKIDEELFVNIWCLYFNLIDIALNKDQEQFPKKQRDEIESDLVSNRLFDTLYGLNFIVNPKLILSLTLITLNNDKVDLVKLRQQVDLYFVHASSIFKESDAEYNSYLELLEVYHANLLVKLGEVEESEFLIKSNPHIKDTEEMIQKMKHAVKDIEAEKRRLAELQKHKEAAAQKRREQRANERAKERLFKELEKAKYDSIEEQHKRNELSKKSSTTERKSTLTVLDVIKKRLQLLNNKPVIILVFSLLSLLALAQNNRLLLNGRIRQALRQFWQKLSATAEMAMRVTYM